MTAIAVVYLVWYGGVDGALARSWYRSWRRSHYDIADLGGADVGDSRCRCDSCFADIDEETALLDPTAVPALITDKTKAILVVHLFGHVAAMPELRALADQHSLLLFEDASQAHGAGIAGRMVGDWGDGAAFSCMGLKLLAGTEGGYAVFRDPQALEVAYLYGHPRGLPPEMNDRLSAAGLLDCCNLLATVSVSALLIQLICHIARRGAARRRNADVLREILAADGFWTLPAR